MTAAYQDQLAKADPGLRAALRAIHPDMELFRVRSDYAPEGLPPGAVRGCWHVRKGREETAFLAPITGPNGEYREPTSGILTELEERDMRKRDVARAVFERSDRERVKRERAQALYKEQRADEMVSDVKAGWRVKGRLYNDEGKAIKRKVAA